jgi:glucose-6-phosphate 1-dehydrogenase
MRQFPLLWSGVFRVSVILIALDYLKSYAYSLSNNPTLLLQQRFASLLSKRSLNLHQFSRSAQFRLQCSAISQNFVILGGSGDLATTKIIPGLFDLCKQYSALSKPTNREKSAQSTQAVVSSTGFNYDDFSVKLAARSDWSDEFLKNKLRNILSPNTKEPSSKNSLHEQLVTEFLGKCSYTCVEAYDINALSLLLKKRNEHENENNDEKRNENVNGNENEINGERKNVRNIVYFALPPKQYLPALNAIKNIQNKEIQDIDKHNDINKTLKTKKTEEVITIKNEAQKKKNEMQNLIEIVLEKPIGYDTETAMEITDLALSAVKNREENIWCVDHYIAKDLAVAILPLKTSKIPSISRLFYEFWNDNYISDVNIVFSDTGILDGRSGYFDECGITRDILQNHLIQLLALICADIDVISTLNNYIDYSKEEEKREILMINNNDINDNKNIKDDSIENIDTNNNIKNSNNNDINWLNLKNNERSNLISEMRSRVLHSIPSLLHSDLTLGQYDSYSSEKGVSINTKTSTFSSCEIQVTEQLIINYQYTNY